MPNIQGAPLEEQVKVLLEQNLAYSKEIFSISKKIKTYILWGRIMSFISLMIFVILPVILGVIYLPSIISNFMGNFMPGGLSQTSGLEAILKGNGLDKNNVIKMINDQGGPLNAYQNILNQNYK